MSSGIDEFPQAVKSLRIPCLPKSFDICTRDGQHPPITPSQSLKGDGHSMIRSCSAVLTPETVRPSLRKMSLSCALVRVFIRELRL